MTAIWSSMSTPVNGAVTFGAKRLKYVKSKTPRVDRGTISSWRARPQGLRRFGMYAQAVNNQTLSIDKSIAVECNYRANGDSKAFETLCASPSSYASCHILPRRITTTPARHNENEIYSPRPRAPVGFSCDRGRQGRQRRTPHFRLGDC